MTAKTISELLHPIAEACSMPCHACIEKFDIRAPHMPMFRLDSGKMILCETCGNKRCPHASDHRLACTGSNESGQIGSIYLSFDEGVLRAELLKKHEQHLNDIKEGLDNFASTLREHVDFDCDPEMLAFTESIMKHMIQVYKSLAFGKDRDA